MSELINQLQNGGGDTLTLFSAVLTMTVSILLGILISVTYSKTHEKGHSQSFAVTLTMLPVILAVIILFVGSNVARAFSLAGTLSIIRFRSAPGDPKDIGYIFFSIAAGLACGVGMYAYGTLFVLVLCLFMVILWKTRFGRQKNGRKALRIMMPENLDYETALRQLLEQTTVEYQLVRVKTTELGSLYELSYQIQLKKNTGEKAFLDALRCLNGNLTVILSDVPTEIFY